VLNSLINAAEQHSNQTTFLVEEVSTVLTWLSETQLDPDKNQVSRGWDWLLAQAKKWQSEKKLKSELQQQSWSCKLGETEIGGYLFVPLDNAWKVRQEALRYRHCADDYIGACAAGEYRLYAIFDSKGRHKATVGYSSGGGIWHLAQIKGFANRTVSSKLERIAETLSAGLKLMDEGDSNISPESGSDPIIGDADHEDDAKPHKLPCLTFFLNRINLDGDVPGQ
jgi:hypothetical protein